MLKRTCLLLMLFAMPGAFPDTASAASSDTLSRCLVATTTGQDRDVLIRWMFMAMARHAAVADVARVTEADREAANRQMAQLFDRLLTVDCREPAVAAMRENPSTTTGFAFGVLGEIAGQEMFVDPAVNEELLLLVDYLDVEALDQELRGGD